LRRWQRSVPRGAVALGHSAQTHQL
jgi:hypothetical protein